MALRADERRDKLRKASGRSTYPLIRRYLNGETRQRKPLSAYSEYIAVRGEPGELKHLSTRRKRKKTSISKVAASEMERAQTVMRASRGSDCIRDSVTAGERLWNSRPERVRAPYPKPELTRQDPEYHGTRETLWERAETTP